MPSTTETVPHSAMNKLFGTDSTEVYLISQEWAQPLQAYLTANETRLAPYEPAREPDYYTLEGVQARIAAALDMHRQRQGISMLFTSKNSTQVIGVINFSGFMYGVFQAGYVGYSIDSDYEGKGIMSEVLSQALEYVRKHYGLHRIMANYLPDNHRSARLLNTLGFEQEGYAKSYLKINGQWRDHVLTALVFDESHSTTTSTIEGQ
ncbi:GNAT family N-acetyltransferase [Psychrobacter sanguinis]|uniref:GNAT family N-acetyltransferase n=1 Tax=Psychrobacter sanguinis TaxID=861445 RepID=A0A844LYX6_9GAMM|nr:GNAT family N-acetyltransferase [Psychrobacter sanguinis]MUG31723.1 GNAT family N-acetyltransferase [Psychrobacter sanguinis]